MALSKEQKRQRRAAAAGPNPRPRGRAPVGANGAEMEWDRERGAWIESALGVVEQHGTAVGDIAVAWEPPLIWDQPRAESGWSADPLLPGSIHAHERCTPRGSRHHIFEHTSPGGTLRMEQYTSPAGVRASGAERCAWRLRIAKSRREARREARGLVAPYSMQCTVCRRELHIMPDGRMVPHSRRETIRGAERERFKTEHAGQEDKWRCPGSHVYFGAEGA